MKLLRDYLKHNPKTHLIFDFDETLFHLLLPWEQKWDEMVLVKLAELDETIYNTYRSGGLRGTEMLNEYVMRHGDKARKVRARYETEFEKQLTGVRVNHELVDFVKTRPTEHMYIWSTNVRPTIENVLVEHEMLHLFDRMSTGTEVQYIKPNPAGFEQLYDGKTPLEQYLMIGDSDNDMGAAQAVGIDFLRVSF